MTFPTIFEKSQKGHHAYSLPKEEKEWMALYPDPSLCRKIQLPLPEISELDLTRHFIELSRRNVGIDNLFYPLGSCTMKFNPRINEACAHLPGFTETHPFADDLTVQGNLRIIHELLEYLIVLTGMPAGTLLPNAGAQGEFIGIRLIAAYHKARRDKGRVEFLVPDSAHGTNPATVTMSGFQIRSIPSDSTGDIDIKCLQEAVSDRTAGLMLTNPNTLGVLSPRILRIAEIIHEAGGLLYYDGANLNPILTVAKPVDMGFDVMHINLHKTFSTPHGGGGPGSGPVLCKEHLKPFLPIPRVEKRGGNFITVWEDPLSIGKIASFHGNFGICLRAYVYIKLNGLFGMRRIAENAVLNANYLKKKMTTLFKIPFSQACMHEFVAQMDRFIDKNIRALDIAKRLLDYNIHAPTVYFPLTIRECFLIEPTECESKKTLDNFIEVLEKIIEEIETNPELIKTAPHKTPVGRLDEAQAARHPVLVDQSLAQTP